MPMIKRIGALTLMVLILIIVGGSVYAATQVVRDIPATVTVVVVPSLVAEPSFDLFQDPTDGATGVKIGITRVFDSITGDELPVPIGDFEARLTYDGSCINVLDEIRPVDFTITAVNIDDSTGITTFSGSAPDGATPPIDLGFALTRLVGRNVQACPLVMEITPLADADGNTLGVTGSLTQTLLRGDARADGDITIADALFIAQYLVGLREECTTEANITCMHPVNAASVRQDGDFDRKTIADALFIAQHLVGLRDGFYVLVP